MTMTTCEQCGRVGIRGFKTTGPTYTYWLGEPFWTTPTIVCAAEKACRKRWPRRREYDE